MTLEPDDPSDTTRGPLEQPSAFPFPSAELASLQPVAAAAIGAQPMSAPAPAPARTVTVEHHKNGPGILIRALWYIFIGWWLSGVVSLAAWFIGLTIIGLPLTFWIFNRIPTILTLRPRRASTTTTVDEDGNIHILHRDHPQPAFWKRAVYFICIGWWFSAIWLLIAWIL